MLLFSQHFGRIMFAWRQFVPLISNIHWAFTVLYCTRSKLKYVTKMLAIVFLSNTLEHYLGVNFYIWVKCGQRDTYYSWWNIKIYKYFTNSASVPYKNSNVKIDARVRDWNTEYKKLCFYALWPHKKIISFLHPIPKGYCEISELTPESNVTKRVMKHKRQQ